MTDDPRVKDPEIAAKEGLVSALCVALIYKDKPIGVIRVYKDHKYEFDWFERQMLKTMAGAAAAVIADAQLFREVKDSMRMKRQLSMARVVQQRLIPQRLPQVSGYDIAPFYVPCQELSGDFYDFLELPEKNLGIVICDVVGKGVRASLLMATIRASLRAHASNVYEITDVLEKVNRDLCAGTEVADFATIFYGVLDTKINRLTYCCAGHMPPVVVRDGKIIRLESRGGVIGIIPDMEYPKEFFDLRVGDLFFMYTDGLSEAANYQGEEFGRHRVESALLAAVGQNLSAEGVAKHCVWEMRKFSGIQYNHDDLTMLAIKVNNK
jgi:sigma-B regulation protein RsbU (phosphoserine phosphatase)